MRPSVKSIIATLKVDEHPNSGWMKVCDSRKVDPRRVELYIATAIDLTDPPEFRDLWIDLQYRRIWVSGWSGHGLRFHGLIWNPINTWRIRRAVKKWSIRRGFGA